MSFFEYLSTLSWVDWGLLLFDSAILSFVFVKKNLGRF